MSDLRRLYLRQTLQKKLEIIMGRNRFSLANLHAMAAFSQLSIPIYNGLWPGEKTIVRNTEPRPEGEATPEQKACKPRKTGKKSRSERKKNG
jgi:hypothetical protein